jgi:hypothetical protein
VPLAAILWLFPLAVVAAVVLPGVAHKLAEPLGLHLWDIAVAPAEILGRQAVRDQAAVAVLQQCYRSTELPKLWPMVVAVVAALDFIQTE